ncbi:hypothetical protein B0H11DRAFT_1915263 [Mycena galericulata]|nr:hypothetical protein B0H11DRAFT_1915263 [Mycena galericulata]
MYLLGYRNRTLEMKEVTGGVMKSSLESLHPIGYSQSVELAVAAVVKYVHALHDFLPEHEAEVSFHSGERIEVVEKDDLYGDGWWKGRNFTGKLYYYSSRGNSAAAPSIELLGSPLQPLPEEPDSAAVSPVSPVPPIQLNDDEQDANTDPNGEVAKATMTDLGSRNHGSNANIDQDAHSFSFASTRDDRTSDDEGDDIDFDVSECEGWQKSTRARVAAKARQAVVEAEKLEAFSSGVGSGMVVPPPDPPATRGTSTKRRRTITSPAHLCATVLILEEDERSESEPVDRLRVAEDVPPTAIAHTFRCSQRTSLPALPCPPRSRFQLRLSDQPPRCVRHWSLPRAYPPLYRLPLQRLLPSSVASSAVRGLMTGGPSKPSSVASAALSAVSESKRRDDSGHASGSGGSANGVSKHPSEWTLEEVVEWIKSKGFDGDVCDKFIGKSIYITDALGLITQLTEQEITGDVVLDLTVDVLKTEICIMVFGKRMRIANAILDLRRPLSPMRSHTLSRKTPGLTPIQWPLAHAVAIALAAVAQRASQPAVVVCTVTNEERTYGGAAGLVSPESAMHTGDLPGSRESVGLGILAGEQASRRAGRAKGRPSQLRLSPNDGQFNVSATQANENDGHEDERAAMSEPAEGKIAIKKDGTSTLAPGPGRHAQGKKGVDASTTQKGNQWTSIFVASLGGTLGRKPAPQYSGGCEVVLYTNSTLRASLNTVSARPAGSQSGVDDCCAFKRKSTHTYLRPAGSRIRKGLLEDERRLSCSLIKAVRWPRGYFAYQWDMLRMGGRVRPPPLQT